MRVIVCFDLPTLTDVDRRNYRKFRKFLIKDGFAMLQESVYTKLTMNREQLTNCQNRLEANKPVSGNIIVLPIPEKTFANMKFLVGENKNTLVQSDQLLLVI